MLPKQIKEDIKILKEKASELSIRRSSFTNYQKKLFIEEIKESVFSINQELNNLSDKMNNILFSSPYLNFEINKWFECLKDNTAFSEPNPRIIYEEQQRKVKKQIQLKEEQVKRDRKIQLELQRRREIERAKVETQRARLEEDKLRENQRKELKSIYYNGPENREKIQEFIDSGYDIYDSIFPLSRMIERGRTIGFIQFLIQKGLKLNYQDVMAFQKAGFFSSQEFLDAICNSKNFNDIRIKSYLTLKQNINRKKKIEEFIDLCLNGPNDLEMLKAFLESDLKIYQNTFSLGDLVLRGRNIDFIVLIIEAGLKIERKDAKVLKENGFLNSKKIIEAIANSKNIEMSAIQYLDKIL